MRMLAILIFSEMKKYEEVRLRTSSYFSQRPQTKPFSGYNISGVFSTSGVTSSACSEGFSNITV